MAETNPNARLEAFCDGIFAIAITLLILDIKVPPISAVHTKAELWEAFAHELPSWFAFLLSFIILLVSWVGHWHTFKLIGGSSPKFTYANGLLMLSVVLVPFITAAVAEYLTSGDSDLAQPAITLYCAVILLNNIAWNLIQYIYLYSESLVKPNVDIKKAKKQALYSRYILVLYAFTFILSFWFPLTAFTIIALSFVSWMIQGIAIKEEKMIYV
jgi:uncharacterized membrane protein